MENIFISNHDFDSYGSNSSDMSFYSVCSYNSQATLLSSSGPTWRPHHSEIVYRTLMSYVFSPASLPADSPVEINFEQKIKKVGIKENESKTKTVSNNQHGKNFEVTKNVYSFYHDEDEDNFLIFKMEL